MSAGRTPPHFLLALGAALWLASASSGAAPPRIGVLAPPAIATPLEAGLRSGLAELGYVEGRDVVFEWRRPRASDDELPSLAADLVREKVDLIVAAGTPAARAAMQATSTVPVVFMSGDPVGTGLAASLARPGANGTGFTIPTPELTAKRLELLLQLAPKSKRVAYLRNPANPLSARHTEEAQRAAQALGVRLEIIDVSSSAELPAALETLGKRKVSGILVGSDLIFVLERARIARAVQKARLPAVFPWREYHEHGVLMSYGASLTEAGRRIAAYVVRILKGANPAELPIEENSKFDLIIDMRVAHELKLTVPQELLYRADEVIR